MQLQESELPDRMTVGEALELFASFYRIRPTADLHRRARAGPASATRGSGSFPAGRSSGFDRARARRHPRVAMLDELTTGLDPQARRDTWDLIEPIRDRGVTVLLVTHFMEEAERLCDRIAVIDAGRLVAIDTPAGLVARVDAEQRIRFRPSAPFDDRLLTALPEVRRVERPGPEVVVTGTGNLLHAVTSVLARHQVIAADLRVEQASLDDAFVALTGRRNRRRRSRHDELRALIATEVKLLFREPITLLLASPFRRSSCLIFGAISAPGARPGPWRAAVASTCSCPHGRDGRRQARLQTLPPPRDVPGEGHPAAAVDHPGGPAGCSSRSSSSTRVMAVHRVGPARHRRPRRVRRPAAPATARLRAAFLLGMASLFAIGLLVAAVAPSARAATASASRCSSP